MWQQQQQQQLVDIAKGLDMSEEARVLLSEDEVAPGRLLQQLHDEQLQAGSPHVHGNAAAAGIVCSVPNLSTT